MSEIKEKKAGLLARDIGYFYEGEDVVFTITLRAKDGSFVDADSVLVTIKDSLGNAKAEDAPAERTAPMQDQPGWGCPALGCLRVHDKGGALMAIIHSKQDGEWHEAETWHGGVPPGPGDTAVIWHEVVVSGDINSPTNVGKIIVEKSGRIIPRPGGLLTDRYLVIQGNPLERSILAGEIDGLDGQPKLYIRIVGTGLRARRQEHSVRVDITL